jgi:hypothetical protein
MPPGCAIKSISCAKRRCSEASVGNRGCSGQVAGSGGMLSTVRHSRIIRCSRSQPCEWAVSSAVEHFLDMEGVTSSILVPPTN